MAAVLLLSPPQANGRIRIGASAQSRRCLAHSLCPELENRLGRLVQSSKRNTRVRNDRNPNKNKDRPNAKKYSLSELCLDWSDTSMQMLLRAAVAF